MLDKLRKMKMITAVLMGVWFYSLTILIHVLVICSIIPYTWVNGGRSESFAAQLSLSMISTLIAVMGVVFTLLIGGNKLTKFNRGITVICWFLAVFWSFGFIQQWLGTPFEKTVCSFVLLLGVLSHLRMAIEKR